jgi:subtilisin family serine protease
MKTFVFRISLLFIAVTFAAGTILTKDTPSYQRDLDLLFKYRHKSPEYINGWALMDPSEGYEGDRTKTFYKNIKDRNNLSEPKPVVVAIIDSGIDTGHVELKGKIWRNEMEASGQPGVDDDGNGYVDDIIGWNFLGDVRFSSLEVAREYERLKKQGTPASDPYFKKVTEKLDKEKNETSSVLEGINYTLTEMTDAVKTLKEKNYPIDPKKLMEVKESYSGKYKKAAELIVGVYMLYGTDYDDLLETKTEYENKNKYLFDGNDRQNRIPGNPSVLSEKNYGNSNPSSLKEIHGTHVAGIIGAQNDKIGHAPFVKIMPLRAVPDEGDERDKDIANAIRYAADNGADIINMSAGKYFSPNPDYVVDAIKYAEQKGVLFVVSAGNEGVDIESEVNFPRKFYMENGQMKFFSNVITVGASSWMRSFTSTLDPEGLNNGFDLAAPFSNFSPKVVDIFAPGVEIYSSVPDNKYKKLSGTSMASPCVTGVAAILKGYLPNLTAAQLKEAIVSSARRYDNLSIKLRDSSGKVPFSTLSRSGGVLDVVNAYEKALTF